jgi:signal transduction histidine kinase/serine phosphatase RsbU (regulator of sigma subunit)
MRGGPSPSPDSPEFLSGGGDLGARMRALDWAATPIGVPDSWPQALRTAVSVCLSSRFPLLIWWGPELVLLYNDDYRSVLGAKDATALGRPGEQVWHEIWDVIGPMLEGVFERGESTWSDDQLLVLERGGYVEEAYFTFSYSPIRDDTGAIGGVFCAVHETTDRVLAERRARMLTALAARAPSERTAEEAIEAALTALETNPADVPYAAVYGRADGVGARLLAATAASAAAGPPPAGIAAGDHAPWPVASVLETGEPAVAWADPPAAAARRAEALVLPLKLATETTASRALVLGVNRRRVLDDDYRAFFALVARDVTTAIATATAFEDERARSDALVELDRAKTDFFSNVSHEFRTPLTLMLGPLEELLRDDRIDRVGHGQVEVAHRNAERLLRLVNTLLDFSRLEAGRASATLVPTDVAEVAADLASTFRLPVEQAGLRLAVDCPTPGPTVLLDRELFERAVLNLLSNALKFTFEGEIRVAVRREDDVAVLEIGDTGEGIAEEELPRLFERFHRVEGARSRSHEGSGIGLAVVEQVAELHGGRVKVRSGLGIGTTFRIELPLAPDDADAAPDAPAGRERAGGYADEAMRWLTVSPGSQTGDVRPSRPRIVFADDNADMRDYVGRLLRAQFEVRTAADGVTALELIRAEPPDLVLADVMMPGLDGFGLLDAVRNDDLLRRVPFVMLSARAGGEAAIEGLHAGADDYVVKPFAATELLARVRANLELGRMRNRLADLDREETERMRGLYDREHEIAESLQRSLLPERLPSVPYLDLSAGYVPAEEAIRIGGDWYDALALIDGNVLLVIGDVAGHGLAAASVMGELRSAARAYALEGHRPGDLLRRMDALMRTTGRTFMATCLCVRLEPAAGRLRYASAGHPPALLRRPDGTVERLTEALAAPLGFLSGRRGREAEIGLEPGSVLGMYTDGLVERRGESIDVGIDALADAMAAGADLDAAALLTRLGASRGLEDDVALLVAHALPVDGGRLDLSLEAVPGTLAPLRRAVSRWLDANGVGAQVAYDILLAVNESATNAIEHAYGPGAARFDVQARRDGDAVEIVVRDNGRWRPARGRHRGRGLGVMRATMDSVDVRRGTVGSEIRMRRLVANAGVAS